MTGRGTVNIKGPTSKERGIQGGRGRGEGGEGRGGEEGDAVT